MKKAVISTGGKQYLVSQGDEITTELLKASQKTLSFDPLMIIDDKTVSVGTPTVTGAKVDAQIIEQDIKTDKVTSIRFKAKKRVHKIRGHRQRKTVLKIQNITKR